MPRVGDPGDAAYWSSRRDELAAQLAEDEDELNRRLAEIYEREADRLEREIAAYYQTYGEGNVIEYRRLLADLSEDDRRLLMEQMDGFAAKYPQYAHLMPVRASIYRLNELEGLQASIRVQQLRIGAIEQDEMRAHFERQARRAADLAAEEMGLGSSFDAIGAQVVRETVGAAWARGGSFSERIWSNREKLAAYLNDDLAKMIARGAAYEEVARSLRSRFADVSRRDAMRLAYTEGTFLLNEAQAMVHETEFELYRLSCVHDKRACEVCRKLESAQAENPARFSERVPGVNFPPMHPWCRCSYEVAVPDWDAWVDSYVERHGGDGLASRFARKVIDDASDHEPSVTGLLQSFERDGVRLSGAHYRIKGAESLIRKIRLRAVTNGTTLDRAADLISDALRYTYVLDDDAFGDAYNEIRSSMEEKGYNFIEVNNSLRLTGVEYRGVNAKVSAPDGYVFEIQFHTGASLDVKERLNHPLYERARLPDTSEAERLALAAQMRENSDSIPMPRGVDGVR
ncbi:hypothetical protein EII22_08950 [Coriobacteriales bacterium OH1046]|nr:hypothetical protein EII22_08950 [Coriobacteriales bacterium OH1046]